MVDVYQIVTDQILAALESGTVPWRKPWSPAGLPVNAVSKKPYRGINPILLGLKDYADPRWVSFNQAMELGGNVKGQKSTLIVFWKIFDKPETPEDKARQIPLLRYYRVFNVEQCDGINLPPLAMPTAPFDPIAEAEKIIAAMPNPPTINHKGQDRAFYSPRLDSISLPNRGSFDDAGEFYCTYFHELTHSTGHASRLNRHVEEGQAQHFGDASYSKEELVAEFGAAYLCGEAGITTTMDNSAAYINSWQRAIKNDKKLVVAAAGKGSRAADYILDRRTTAPTNNKEA